MTRVPGSAWAAVVVALALRLALIAFHPASRSPEPYEYERLVVNLLAGRGYAFDHFGAVYRSFHSGLPYVAVNTVVCALTDHHHTALLAAQSLITAALVLVVFSIAARLFDPRTATVAAFLMATHPAFLVYDTQKLHSLGLDSLLMIGSVALAMSLSTEASLFQRLATGALFALALYGRGTFIVFAAAVPPLLGYQHRRTLAGAVRFALPIWLGATMTLAPWLIRNFAIHHTLVMQTPQAEQFWRGNHHGATGTAHNLAGEAAIHDDPALLDELPRLDERGQMQAFTARARAFWREHPGEGLALFFRKLFYFFTVTPTAGLLYSRTAFVVYNAYYAVISLFALVGTRRLARRPQPPPVVRLLPLIAIVGVALVHAAFYINMRHRWGVEPLILVLSAAGMTPPLMAVWRRQAATRPPAADTA